MTTIALIGADGAGKTSVARRLEELDDVPVKYIYMGANPDAASHSLPTTRLARRVKRWLGKASHAGGPPDPSRERARPRGLIKRSLRSVKSTLRVGNQLAEEWYRLRVARRFERRGFVPLFDRHFFADHYAHDIAPSASEANEAEAPTMGATDRNGDHPLEAEPIRPVSRDRASRDRASRDRASRGWARRFHGWVLDRIYPRPEVVILLDAPAEVLFARKGEGTVDLIESRRREYFRIEGLVPRFVVVDVDRPLNEVVDEVATIVRDVSGEANEAER